MTISAWINMSDFSTNRRIMQKGDSDNQYRLLAEYGLLKFHLNGVANGTLTASLPSTGTWHHIAGTYDGSVIRLYADGSIVAQNTASGKIATTTSDLYLGTKKVASAVGDHFKGIMDDVAIWNRALSESEIQALFSASSACYDLTGDDKVDVFDLVYVGSRFSAPNSDADLTGNGVVDLSDIQLLTSQIGSTCINTPAPEPLTVFASPATSSFATSTTVTLNASDVAATIYYTMDESIPTTSSSVYSSPLTFSATTILKFFAKTMTQESVVATETYTKTGSGTLQAVISVDEVQWFKDNISFPSGLSLITGYAPFPVFFEGWQSSSRDEIVEYSWNFGNDPTANSGNPNTMKTFNAAHAFETPGTYDVTLTVKNAAGQTSTAYKTINVLARPGTTYYVDSVIGNDSYDGKCTTVQGSCGPWKTATNAFGKTATGDYQPGDSVLFKSGQEFEISGGTTGAHFNNLLFSTYGSGAKPIIRYTGTAQGWVINDSGYSSNIAFVDLVFEMRNGTRNYLHGIYRAIERSKSILYLRGEFYEGDALFGHGTPSAAVQADGSVVSNIYVIDSKYSLRQYDALPDGGTGSIIMYGWIGRFASVNSEFDLANEQIGYFSYMDKGIMVGSKFSRPPFGRPGIRVSGHIVANQGSNNVHVADNYFMGWVDPLVTGCGAGSGKSHQCNTTLIYTGVLLQIGPNTGAVQSQKDFIVERNIFTNFQNAIQVTNAENITIRNNILVTPQHRSGAAVALNPNFSSYQTKPLKNIKIIGNTMYNGAHWGSNLDNSISISPYQGTVYYDAIGIQQTEHQQITIMNNLFVQRQYEGTGGTRAIWINWSNEKADLMNEITINNNIYDFPYTDTIVRIGTSGSTYANYTLSQWQALPYGYDTDSLKTSIQFAQTINVPDLTPQVVMGTLDGGRPNSLEENVVLADSYKQMFKLSNLSPAINAGVSLPNDLHYDYAKTTRPIGSAYDIGAYEQG
ncbi:MAG: PKD domain-containing protein [archaeon]|nr:PKD domain-containing protein [archaeon]